MIDDPVNFSNFHMFWNNLMWAHGGHRVTVPTWGQSFAAALAYNVVLSLILYRVSMDPCLPMKPIWGPL